MSNAGRNKEFEKILADNQEKLYKKLGFIKTEADLLEYVGSLSLEMKTEKGEILFRDSNKELQYFPCVSKFISFSDPAIKFPKDKKRNPFECAKIQLMLYKRANLDNGNLPIENKIGSFRCNCHDCYRVALQGIFHGDGLCLS